jgi:hypothetical protein
VAVANFLGLVKVNKGCWMVVVIRCAAGHALQLWFVALDLRLWRTTHCFVGGYPSLLYNAKTLGIGMEMIRISQRQTFTFKESSVL